MENIGDMIDMICEVVTFFSLVSYLKAKLDKIRHKEPSKPWTNKEIVSIIIVFSLAYIPWYNYSVTLEQIPSGEYEIKIGIRKISTDESLLLSTAKIEISRETDYTDYEDYLGNSGTKTKVYENVYLKSVTYQGEQIYLSNKELQIGYPMEIENWENERFEIEVCSNELDLNTVGLTRADVRANRSILSTVLYYAEVMYAAVYTCMLIKRKYLEAHPNETIE